MIRNKHFRLNKSHSLFHGLVFAGLGGDGCVGSVRYADSSPRSNHGTLTNMSPPDDWVIAPDLDRWALDAPGGSSRIDIGNLKFSGRQPVTIAAWIQRTSGAPNVQGWIVSQHSEVVLRTNGGSIDFVLNSFSSNDRVSGGSYVDGTLAHVVGMFDGTDLSVWVDGEWQASVAPIGNYSDNGTSWSVAGSTFTSSGPYGFAGEVADAMVWNRALSPSEIQAIAQPFDPYYGGLIERTRKIFPSATIVPTPVTEATNKAYISAGLSSARGGGQSPTSQVNTAYISAGLLPNVAAAPTPPSISSQLSLIIYEGDNVANTPTIVAPYADSALTWVDPTGGEFTGKTPAYTNFQDTGEYLIKASGSDWESTTQIDFSDMKISGELTGWNIPDSLTVLYLDDTQVSEDITSWTFPNSTQTLYLNNTYLSADIGGWTLPTGLRDFRFYGDNVSVLGDISSWSLPNVMQRLHLQNTSVSGSITGLAPSNSDLFYDYFLNDTSVNGDITDWALSTSGQKLRLTNTSTSGDISEWSVPATYQELLLSDNMTASGTVDASDWHASCQIEGTLTYTGATSQTIHWDTITHTGLTEIANKTNGVFTRYGDWTFTSDQTFYDLLLESGTIDFATHSGDFNDINVSGGSINVNSGDLVAANQITLATDKVLTVDPGTAYASGVELTADSYTGYQTLPPAPPVTQLTFVLNATGFASTTPALTSPITDAEVIWHKPSTATFTGKTPVYTEFDETGTYTVKVTETGWNSVTSVDFSDCAQVGGNIEDWNIPTSLQTYYVNDTDMSGDVAQVSLVNSVTTFNLHNTNISGSVQSFSFPTSLQEFSAYNTNVTGDISAWSLPNSTQKVKLHNTSVQGDISGLSLPTSLAELELSNTSVNGDISVWTLPSAARAYYFTNTSTSGNLSDLTIPSLMTGLRLSENMLADGDITATGWQAGFDIRGKVTYTGTADQNIKWGSVSLTNLTEVAQKSAGLYTRNNPWDFASNQLFYDLHIQSGEIDFNGYSGQANLVTVTGSDISVNSGDFAFTQTTLAQDQRLSVSSDGTLDAPYFYINGEDKTYTGYLVLPTTKVEQLSFVLGATGESMTPSLTAPYDDAEIVWVKPDTSEFTGKTPTADQFDATGSYSLKASITGWDATTTFDFGGCPISGDIASWTIPNSVVWYDVSSTTISGDISSVSFPASTTYLYLDTTDITGDVSSFSFPTSLMHLFLYGTNVTGDVSSWSLPSNFTKLYVQSLGLEGDVSSWTLPNTVERLYLYSTNIEGDVGSWTLPTDLTYLYLHNTSVDGDIGGWAIPSSTEHIRLDSTSTSGDFSNWSLPSTLATLYMTNSMTAGGNIDATSWNQSLDIQGKLSYTGATTQSVNWGSVSLANLTEVANKVGGTYTRESGTWTFTEDQAFYDLHLDSGFTGDIVFNGYSGDANNVTVSGGDIIVGTGDFSFTQVILATDRTLAVEESGLLTAEYFEASGITYTGYTIIPTPRLEQLTFYVKSASSPTMSPGITAPYANSEVTWVKPSESTFTGKSPSYTNFDEVGLYTVKVSETGWNTTTWLDFSSCPISGSVADWNLPTSLQYFYLSSTDLGGDISAWSLPSSLRYAYFQNCDITGDVGAWTLPTQLRHLYLYGTNVYGDLSSWAALPSFTQQLQLNDMASLSGDISSWNLPTSLSYLYLDDTSVEGDLTNWNAQRVLSRLRLQRTNTSGDFSEWSLSNSLTQCWLSHNMTAGGSIDAAPWSNILSMFGTIEYTGSADQTIDWDVITITNLIENTNKPGGTLTREVQTWNFNQDQTVYDLVLNNAATNFNGYICDANNVILNGTNVDVGSGTFNVNQLSLSADKVLDIGADGELVAPGYLISGEAISLTGALTIPISGTKQFYFTVTATGTDITPVVVGSYGDSDIVWEKPDRHQFNGKAPAATLFDLTGEYDAYVITSNWNDTTSIDFSEANLEADTSGWIIPSSLEYYYLQNSDFSGDITSWSLPNSLKHLYLQDTLLTGTVTNWTLPTGGLDIKLSGLTLAGNVTSWSLPVNLTGLYLNGTSISGDISDWTVPASLLKLYLTDSMVATGSIDATSWNSSLDLQASLSYPGSTSQTINWGEISLTNITESANKAGGTYTRYGDWSLEGNQTFNNLTWNSGDLTFNGYSGDANIVGITGGSVTVDSGNFVFTELTLATDKVMSVSDGNVIAPEFFQLKSLSI